MKESVTHGIAMSSDDAKDRTRPESEDALFDPEAACRHLGIDVSSFARIFDCIWTEVSTRRSLLEEAFQAGDFSLVALHAHTIKSSAATIGAEGLRRAAEAVECAAGKADEVALAEALATFRRAKETLSNLLGMR